MKLAWPLLLLAVVVATGPACAASFDCAKAARRIEKAICADPALGKLDVDIAAAYVAAGVGLDDAMRQRLKRSQHEWLSHRLAGPELGERMKARLALLRATRKTVGGVAFLDLAVDSARPMYLLSAAPGAAAYNRWVDSVWDQDSGELTLEEGDREQAKCEADAKPEERGDCMVEGDVHAFKASVPAPGILSVLEWTSQDQHAAHPINESHHYSWWLSRGGRIGVQDTFVGDAWKAVIAQAVRSDTEIDGATVPQDAIDSVCDPDAWWLTADALVLEGDGYTFGRGRGQVEIDIPWHALRAAMRPDFAAALGVR